MATTIRTLLLGISLIMAGYLAPRQAAGAAPEPIPVAAHDTGQEPALDVPFEGSAVVPASFVEPESLDTVAKKEEIIWAEELVVPPPLNPVAPAPAPGHALSGYQVQRNKHVSRFLNRFRTGDRRPVVERWLVRSGRYLPMMLEIFRQKGLPEDLVFTAMIESGFDPLAVSRVGARGLWQFMTPTARLCGLRVDRWVDERLDPEKATVAAANHLRDLYGIFGSWELAQAAYNAGALSILKAIRGTGSRDFWRLSRGALLPDETKDFVPAIHAATLIGRQPQQYGFAVTPEEPLRYEQITVPGATRLKYVAALSGIPLEQLEQLNPQLRLKQTPPDAAYRLKVPPGSAAVLHAALDRDAGSHKVAATVRSADRGKGRVTDAASPAFHVVRLRDTSWSIAKRYGISVDQLARWNGLDRPALIFPGERLRVVAA